ncbi:hypothetical protein IMZ48_11495, partial [Candidatus Bathyarchaeota archaeon]|nr:hypothetical protein [Candidatus Bathyarchaeota archaeon]
LPCRRCDGGEISQSAYHQLVPQQLSHLFDYYRVLVHGADPPPACACAHSPSRDSPPRSHAADSVSAAPSPRATVDTKPNELPIPDSAPPNTPYDTLRSLFHRLGLTSTTRRSRRDAHLPASHPHLSRSFLGTVCCPALPPFELDMSARTTARVPATPRVISPSPTPESSQDALRDGPTTRSAARKRRTAPLPVEELVDEDEEIDGSPPPSRRARTRSRSPIDPARVSRLTSRKATSSSTTKRPEPAEIDIPATDGTSEKTNGHLAPPGPATPQGWSWRDFSRSPSPLGLIPVHRKWRTFIHKHEVPRKALHVSIGFFTLWLYVSGTQTSAVPPWLMTALVPIASVDLLRHHYEPFNRFYVSVLGALMRESEVEGYNGVIFYLLGAWFVLYFFPKDVGVMGILLLSWCDTAASTFGRLWGRYTPRLRKNKSLAGSFSAFLVGVATAAMFWGVLAPRIGPFPGDEDWPFMFQGVLRLPGVAAEALGLEDVPSISGSLALGVVSLWSGLMAAGSELMDIFGWDDNLTIPVLSGIGIWGFLKVFT